MADARKVLGGLSALVKGKPSTVKVPGLGEIAADRIPAIDAASESYMRRAGRAGEHRIDEYPEHNPELAARIAQAYDAMRHAPNDPEVKRSYDALIQETVDQYKSLKDAGVDIRFLKDGMSDPYAASPTLGYVDLQKNGRLWVFPTEQGFGTLNYVSDNPLLKRVGRVGDLENATANDAFRVVHDLYGHFGPGNPFFRAPGEERAWLAHSRMYSPEARGAMTSETRGQNSWVNFGPFGEQNRKASGADTVYADQKAGLMPEWTMKAEGKARGGLATLAKGGQPSEEDDRALLESMSPGGPRYVAGDKADGEGFDRARKNYQRFPKATGEISVRPETLRGALATALSGDSRMSPAKARFVEGLTGSTPAGGGLGVGLADFVPGLGAVLTASDVANSDAPVLDAAIGAGMQAASFAGPLVRAGKAAATSKAGKAAIGAAAAGAAMSPDDAEAGIGGLRNSMWGIGKNFTISDRWEQQLREEGKRSLWRDQGVYKGRDGLWRFEIDDSKSKIRDLPSVGKARKFTDYIDHTDLLNEYPEFKNVDVHYNPDSGNYGGFYSPGPGTILGDIHISKENYASDPEAFKRILLHEAQHGIQQREGFIPGANKAWAGQQMMEQIRKGANPGRRSPLDPPLSQDAIEMFQHLDSSIGNLPESWRDKLDYEAYLRNYGETEARNVEWRRDFTPEQRRDFNQHPEDTASIAVDSTIDPKAAPEKNFTAYETMIQELAAQRAREMGRKPRFADGGGVEAKSALDELLELAGGQP